MVHNYVSLIKDENAVQYYVHDNRFTDGVIDDTTISLSYSDNSSGCKSYCYKDCSKVGDRIQFTLCDIQSGSTSDITYAGISADDVLSMRIPNTLQISFFAKVYSVNTSTSQLVIEYLPEIAEVYSELDQYLTEAEWNTSLPCRIWFPRTPNIGDDELSVSSVALGSDNFANGTGSVATGKSNLADGDASFVAGEGNVVGDCSAAFGISNNALGKSSLCIGEYNTTYGKNSAAIGAGVKTYDDGQLVIGSGLQVPSSPESYAFMVGNTSGNPLMLKKTGDLYVRGDVYSKTNGNLSSTTNGIKLNGVRSSAEKLYLLGTMDVPGQTSQTVENLANNQVYATDGVLNAKSFTSTQKYITVGNIKVWISNTAPTDGVSDGDIGIGW